MQLNEFIKQSLDKVQRMGPVRVASQLHSFNSCVCLSAGGLEFIDCFRLFFFLRQFGSFSSLASKVMGHVRLGLPPGMRRQLYPADSSQIIPGLYASGSGLALRSYWAKAEPRA